MDEVVVAAEDIATPRHLIGENPVAALGRELGGGIGLQVFGLGGEADHQARALRAGGTQVGQDVRVFRKFQSGCAVAAARAPSGLLDLLLLGRRRPPIGDRCRANGDVGGEALLAGG